VTSADFEMYIIPVEGGPCGRLSKFLYFRNIHSSRRIRIWVRKSWTYEGKNYEEFLDPIDLEANGNASPAPNEKDKLMGCPIPGPTSQQFFWEVKRAAYS
jgi:hypothetical protein